MEERSHEVIGFAMQLVSQGDFPRALNLYLRAFGMKPEIKPQFEHDFRLALTRCNDSYFAVDKMQEIFTNFRKANAIFPENAWLTNDLGKYLYKYGYYTEAWGHFQKALKLDSGSVEAEKNLNSVKNLLVERWHFRMLNDKIRNEAYHAAIQASLKHSKDSVLDVGTGTGLLAMYAHECNPKAIVGCDSSETMTKLAECIIKENGKETISIINRLSTELDHLDIDGKKTFLVTELFDASLFGEHILHSMLHAKQHLITKTGHILPNKAEFFVAGVRCDSLKLKYQLSSSAKKLLNIPNCNVHISTYSETYDCDDVHMYKDLTFLTEPQSLLKIDFNDLNDIQEKISRTEPYSVKFKANKSGEMNLIVGWFNLHLTESISLTTDPRCDNRANAWQQAVFFDHIPVTVAQNDDFKYNFSIIEDRLALLSNYRHTIIRISIETLRFLNDADYLSLIEKCIDPACKQVEQLTDMSQGNVADLCPFPYFGLLMLKRGAKSLVCCAKTSSDKIFFKKVFKACDVQLSKVKILVGDEWNPLEFGQERYHAIFNNIFELGGDLDLRLIEISLFLKLQLHDGGVDMPCNIKIMGQVVNSSWLDTNNRIYDENVSNYKIACHVNKYQVSQNFFIDFSRLEYDSLTDDIELGEYENGLSSQVINVPIVASGDANAILCWYEIELIEKLGIITTKRENSFVDGTVFLANPPIPMEKGRTANILQCVDYDGAFKLMLDAENNSNG